MGKGWLFAEGQAALFRRGETHSKGSETGMTAVMVQIGDLTPSAVLEPVGHPGGQE